MTRHDKTGQWVPNGEGEAGRTGAQCWPSLDKLPELLILDCRWRIEPLDKLGAGHKGKEGRRRKGRAGLQKETDPGKMRHYAAIRGKWRHDGCFRAAWWRVKEDGVPRFGPLGSWPGVRKPQARFETNPPSPRHNGCPGPQPDCFPLRNNRCAACGPPGEGDGSAAAVIWPSRDCNRRHLCSWGEGQRKRLRQIYRTFAPPWSGRWPQQKTASSR